MKIIGKKIQEKFENFRLRFRLSFEMFTPLGSRHDNENEKKNPKKSPIVFQKLKKKVWAYGPGKATTKIWKKSVQ